MLFATRQFAASAGRPAARNPPRISPMAFHPGGIKSLPKSDPIPRGGFGDAFGEGCDGGHDDRGCGAAAASE